MLILSIFIWFGKKDENIIFRVYRNIQVNEYGIQHVSQQD